LADLEVKSKGLKDKICSKQAMEIKLISKGKTKIQVEIVGEDHTFCNSLRKELWNDKDVKVAGYNIEHPLVSSPVITIETTKKDPKKVLEAAIKRLKTRNAELKKSVSSISKKL